MIPRFDRTPTGKRLHHFEEFNQLLGKSSGDDKDLYALHPTAPKGTEIMVKNMMNGKTVTVKVIGKLPATSANENVLIKISGSAAKKLGVLDERFLVAVYYDEMKSVGEDAAPTDLK